MHRPVSLNRAATGLLYYSSDIYVRIGNFVSNTLVFHVRKIPQETSMVGFSVSPRIPPKVSWNDPPISLCKVTGHFLYSWAVGPICSTPLMLQDSLPLKAELGTEIFFSRLWICLLSLSMHNWRSKKKTTPVLMKIIGR